MAMAKPVLNATHFQSEPAAFAYVEARLWPHGAVCPECENGDRVGKLQGVRSKPSKKHPEGIEQHGLYKCYACSLKFSVRKGTIFEDSHLPLHLWLQIIHLMCCSKKGIATRQVQRMLQCSMKTAWHLTTGLGRQWRQWPTLVRWAAMERRLRLTTPKSRDPARRGAPKDSAAPSTTSKFSPS
jgi:transposase-like protein